MHIVAIAVLGQGVVYEATVAVWLGFLLTTIALCWLWAATVGRGPLEWVLHRVSTRAADIAPDELPAVGPPRSRHREPQPGQAHS